jgi:hypothetical protein
MKGVHMRHVMAMQKTGLLIAIMIFLFTLTTVGPASAMDSGLKSMLSKNGISMKIVKLDRTDGFKYGLSFKGPKRTIVILPGIDHMFLVQTDGREAIFQADGTGNLQVIQADDVDIRYVLCLGRAVLGFFESLTYCSQGDVACYLTSIFTVFTDVADCNTGITP